MLHFLPILIFVFMLKCSLLCACGGPRKFLSFVKDLLTVGEDYWTWTTRTGEVFEDAEIAQIETDEVLIKHRFGMARLVIEHLSERSRYILFRSQKWADHVASREMIEAFPVHSTLTAQAA
jgi:hypothetical protein